MSVARRALQAVARRVAALRPSLVYRRGDVWCRDRLGRHRYPHLAAADVAATRRSDTLFIFGSGYSLTEISAAEWAHFEAHDTLGFNWFPRQRMVRCDYHLVREVAHNDSEREVWAREMREYGDLIAANPFYARTIYFVQEGWTATNGNGVIGLGVLPPGARVCRFRSRSKGVMEPPTTSWTEGLVHAAGSLNDCVNAGAILGWTRIVLVGVDLYDNRYFWLPYDTKREALAFAHPGLSHDAPFPNAAVQIEVFRLWRGWLEERGINLFIYNPRSLLAEALPVYDAPAPDPVLPAGA